MAKRRSKRRRKTGKGTSKQERKHFLGKMSLGCLVLLLLSAAWLILPRVLSGGPE